MSAAGAGCSADRVIGCIVGGAIGDAWGFPHEGSIEPSDVADRSAGSLSDETQLVMATCEAIMRCGRVEPAAIADRMLLRFQRHTIVGLGASTPQALRNLEAGAHWALAGARGDRAAGNGPATRVAPLAFLLDPEERSDRDRIREVGRITHHHEQAYAGALAMVHALRWACGLGEGVDAPLPSYVAERLPDSAVCDRARELAALDPTLAPRAVASRFGASGYVAESVPLALFAAQRVRERPFAEVVRAAIEAGGDADSIGSMVGQIAGAALGIGSIPVGLCQAVVDMRSVELSADGLARVVRGEPGVPPDAPSAGRW